MLWAEGIFLPFLGRNEGTRPQDDRRPGPAAGNIDQEFSDGAKQKPGTISLNEVISLIGRPLVHDTEQPDCVNFPGIGRFLIRGGQQLKP
jgi:hypothetical protein